MVNSPAASRSRSRGSPASAAAKTNRRPLAFVLHSALGLKLSLFLLLICGSGVLAVLGDEIEWLSSPRYRASAIDRRVSWQTQYASAQTAFPDYQLEYIEAGEGPYLVTRIHAIRGEAETRIIYVDPATGRVQGESGFATPRAILRALHYYLFMPGQWGFFAVASMSWVLLGSLVTGLLTYKKFWRGWLRWPRRGRSARLFWGDLHRLTALWTLWFVALVGVTGAWYFTERIAENLGAEFELVPTSLPAASSPELRRTRRPLDELIARAQEVFPELRIQNISLPAGPDDPLIVGGDAKAWLVRNRANGVELDPYTGAVLAVHHAESLSPLGRWAHTADVLHFGSFAGLASKLAWALFGAALCMLSASGIAIYAKRLLRAADASAPRAESAPRLSAPLRPRTAQE
jgi:uncharacterized iron-regulated membrane protein